MEAEELKKGAGLILKECNNNITQDFEYTFDKQTKHAGEYNLCVTVTNGRSRRDRGGFPTHLVRFFKN
mgnify:FL=1